MLNDAIDFASTTIRTMLSSENRDDRPAQVKVAFQQAREHNVCPVTYIMETYLLSEAKALADGITGTSAENEMARMLMLANYAQRDYAVRVFQALEFNDYADELARQPEIVHRDDLPAAQKFLTDLLIRVDLRCAAEGYSERYRTRFQVAEAVLRRLRGTFSELDGHVPKIPAIMAWFIQVFDIAHDKIDDDAVVTKLRAVA